MSTAVLKYIECYRPTAQFYSKHYVAIVINRSTSLSQLGNRIGVYVATNRKIFLHHSYIPD